MSKKYSLLDSEMKEWEHKYRRVIDPSEYVILRIDGRAFHTFTRGLDKPFDSNLKDSMVYTSEALAKGIQGVRLVYTQSDEISVLITSWKDGAFNPKPELPFGGVEAKLVSLSASIASTAFNWYGDTLGWSKANFDSRVFTFPGTEEGRELVSKYFLWRHRDAVKNSVSMAASAHFSHKELHQKSVSDRLMMLQQKGVDWEDTYQDPFKYGTYLYPVVVKHMLEDGEVYYRRNWDTSSHKTSANVRVHIPSIPAVDTSTS